MSRCDSDSKRRGSRFDPQPSPKRYRKDGKQERGRVRTASNGGHTPHHALHHSNLQADTQVRGESDKKNYRGENHNSPEQEERGSAGQVGRSSGERKAGERGWWKDVRNQHNEKEEISQGREQSEEKSQAKPDDNTSHRRGGYSDRKVDQPPTSRKGPAFRDKNIQVDSENVNLTATVTVKSSKFDHPLEMKERKKERREKAAIHTIWRDLKSNLQSGRVVSVKRKA